MKIPRIALLIIIASLGALIIGYGLFRQFTGIGINEEWERRLMNGVIVIAILLFFYNRKLVNDEKLAEDERERTKRLSENDDENKSDPD